MPTIKRVGILLLACLVFSLVAGVEPALTATNPFNPATGSPIATGAGASFVATGDLNGDGKPDVVVVNSNANSISVLIATGNGAFKTPVNYLTGSFPNDVVIADVLGNGRPDLVVTNSDGTINLFINNGAGLFTTPLPTLITGTGAVPEGVAVADFNGDRIPDIVVSDSGSNTVTVFLGTGLGSFTPGITFLTSSSSTIFNGPSGVAVGDFNGDGKLDLATSNNNDNTVSILLGNGNGTFQAPSIINMNPNATSACSDPDALLVADFNGDSKADIAVACTGGTVSILLGNGNGTFATPVSYTTFDNASGAGLGPESIAAADFDGQNGIDLVIADSVNDAVILLNKGNNSGTFSAPIPQPAGKGAFGVATADFNADNKPDLAVANSTDGTVSILLNGGTITSTGGGGGGSCTPTTCPANFSITVSPTTVTTKAGTLVTYIVTVTPGPGFSEPVTLTCASSAPISACSFSSKTVLPRNGASVNSSMSVATNFTPSGGPFGKADPSQSPMPHSNNNLYAMLSFGGAGILGLVVPASLQRNKRRRMLGIGITALALFVLLIALQGCGVGKHTTSGGGVTPPGTYTVTVTGTAGSGATTQVATATPAPTLIVN